MSHPENSLPAPLPYYAISYDDRPPLLRGEGVRPLNAEEITETCEVLLATALYYGCPYWLLDGRSHQQAQPQELHEWMREEYFPRVQAELQGQPCIAFLVPLFVWTGISQQGYAQVVDASVHGVRLGWFTQENQALPWLAHQRTLQYR
ncbi:hypothetical protein MTX78_23670 (plasmid) [Hymenobacter tibetensis]|uniref:Uncharacterized protein n=1 Tax=Hymenobacter tibetensis TaxID=497967 RepID=A0ABY4D519_9BACT|nr:hypothetical protein [Hymenobacter tibetensis]UOG77437.1 hypothetical protein MTX78_23670 [Hymenobacter tibetensis]